VEKIFMDERTLGTKISKGESVTYPVNRAVILQPSYLPWIGYFEQMVRADQYVFLDNVQFTRRDWRNRNKIRTNKGWAWLTVPVEQKNHYEQSLKETRIDNSVNWNKKHREAIRINYSRTPFFETYYPWLESVYDRQWEFLLDLCYETTEHIMDILDITTPTWKASELSAEGTKSDFILNLCREMKATHYLTGGRARDYLIEEDFNRARIELEYQEYDHPEYPQRYSGFESHLSVIDLLFNVGDKSRDVIMNSVIA
jgi:hypothetical protein